MQRLDSLFLYFLQQLVLQPFGANVLSLPFLWLFDFFCFLPILKLE
ncbi:Hypothetical protein I595_1896 [Croceitalea dokdonensis DOKDO 023]|uniref:Uncharacterized protein n=1 Tax=Croceitalea dokdonensis DOKDO 023 TaxID=1300341 RepID=A0A0P7AUP4_9FLAO|nr:Hypothetical protein I595_1896 [Croceitalea dokdonensis DOKDO 023]